jgi:hypothetical protein
MRATKGKEEKLIINYLVGEIIARYVQMGRGKEEICNCDPKISKVSELS